MGRPLYKWDIDTPALIIDLDLLNKNINSMAEYCRQTGMRLRPHAKTHKTPIISHMQIRAGAVGVTCQKLGEAEVFAQSGIGNILISNEVAGERKIRRLAGLSAWADVTVGIDDYQNASDISEAALEAGTRVKVALEVNAGRCGVAPGEPALALAQYVLGLKGLEFAGIWCHEIMTWGPDRASRKATHRERIEPVLETKRLLEKHGIPVNMCSAGATVVYDIISAYPEVSDVQAGSYVLMDWTYRKLEGLERFENALTVMTTVISKPPYQGNRAYTDCGIKSISQEHTGMYREIVRPVVKGDLGAKVKVFNLSEEHCALEGDVGSLKVGDRIELIPSHCCSTVNLHDRFYCILGDKVEAVWPVLARGRSD